MSQRSYRRNVNRGVTGAHQPTCFPAALEQISPFQSLSPETYITYLQFMGWCDRDNSDVRRVINPSWREMISMIGWELGGFTCDDTEFYSVDSFKEFRYVIRRLVRRECRIAVDIEHPYNAYDEVHTLGLVETAKGDHFKLTSNYVPFDLRGVVSLDYLYEFLAEPDEEPTFLYPFQGANITALPAA